MNIALNGTVQSSQATSRFRVHSRRAAGCIPHRTLGPVSYRIPAMRPSVWLGMRRTLLALGLLATGLALITTPQVHAIVRDANALFAAGIARRGVDTSGDRPTAGDLATGLDPIPSAMGWTAMGAGCVCLLAGVGVAARREHAVA